MFDKLTLRKVLFLLFVVSLLGVSFWGISLGQNQEKPIELDPLAANWRPENRNIVEVDVHIKGDFPDSHVDFSLSNVTDWEGYCMNDGNQSDLDKDLKLNLIDQKKNTPLTWSGGGQTISASWTGAAPGLFILKVKSYDYGAYGDLTATLHKQDASASQEPPSDTVSIPRDDNNNRISDGWRKDGSENYDASADDETGPTGNNYPGDGLSVFEEYRGFRVSSEYVSTDPVDTKDLFVYTACDDGIGYASNLPTSTGQVFKVHPILEHEMGTGKLPIIGKDRRIDYKGADVPGGKTTKQKALRVRKDNTKIESGSQGTTLGETDGEGPPHAVGDITIYYRAISEAVYDTTRSSSQATRIANRRELAKKTIAHEIGHGINVKHHDIITIFDSSNNEVRDTTQNCVVENGFSVDVTGLYVVVGTMYRLDHPFSTPMYNHAARFRLK